MNRLARAVRGALGGGRFVSVWSALVVAPLSLTIMSPVGAGIDVARAFPATAGATLALLAGLGVVALCERCIRRPAARIAVVVAGVVVCAALRPLAQDQWAAALALPTPAGSQLPFRIATNVVVWPVVLTAVAVLVRSMHALRRTNALLRDVARELAGARDRAVLADRAARAQVEAAAVDLQRGVDDLAERADAGAVRRLAADGFRAWTLRLQDLADEPASPVLLDAPDAPDAPVFLGAPDTPVFVDEPVLADEPAAPTVPDPSDARRTTHRRGRILLRVPPRGVVTVLYTACTLPFAMRTTAPAALVAGIVVVCALGAAVDAVPRTRRFGGDPRTATAAFLACALATGGVLSVLATMTGQTGVPALLPIVDYVAFALAAALCTGAVHALRREQRRLSAAVARAQDTAREGARPVREGLRRVAELLHREGQGACLHIALAHPEPSRTQTAHLREALSEIVRRMPGAYASAEGGTGADAIEELTETWGRVLDLRLEIAPPARGLLDRAPGVARDVYDLVAEGLLNVLKHSGRRRADVEIALVPTGAGPRVRVRVRSDGAPATGATLRPGSHVRALGARLTGDDDAAVLEASFAPAAVVSPEHRAGTAPRAT
ncbi:MULTISPECIES: hypothetical protein [unclassified Microbacterium]|uniref:hypothetical protein n=1 Tax=unclassified Microbacterium TaxID=2609290 RepID=UPI003016A5AB